MALNIPAALFLPRPGAGAWTGVSKSLSSLDLLTDDCSLKKANEEQENYFILHGCKIIIIQQTNAAKVL